MGEEKIRFGILGCAMIARKVSRAIRMAPNALLYAIGSRSLEKAEAFASANEFPSEVKLYGSYEMVLDDPSVDAVYIPLPTTLHLEWALKSAHKKKHILLDKPPALSVEELDQIIEACHSSGVQLMDCTMWMHHPRTPIMKDLLRNSELFGELKMVHSTFTLCAPPDFFQSNIRVRPDLDALGVLGDLGWYCIRAILWANDYQLPQSVTALPGAVFNEAGVIMACGCHFFWKDGRVSTYHCSYFSDMSMDLAVHGTKGTLRLHDFVIPYEENSASFTFSSGVKFAGIQTGWEPRPSEHLITAKLPQEALMVQELARLVKDIRDYGGKPDLQWPSITRKTQMLLNAINTSIRQGFISVTL
eukprot:Gb_11250 [translate_table: standard]